MNPGIQTDWYHLLKDEFQQPYFSRLQSYIDREREVYTVYPPPAEVYTSFQLTPYEKVKVVILGQDPYHDEQQAHGLAFSVRQGIKAPPSLKNIFRELQSDLGIPAPPSGDLSHWAEQGVLLLNTVLTVRAHQPNSHRNQGWETFTDAVLRVLNLKTSPIVFILWGNPAQKKSVLISSNRHHIIQTPHPSPLSAHRGFFGSRPFSKTNEVLRLNNLQEINWTVDYYP